MMLFTKLTTGLFLAGVCASTALAQNIAPQRCKTYTWKPGDVITVDASLYKTTSIQLPESSLDVVWGAKELWETEFVRNHIFIKPTTALPQGQETTATAIGESNNTYNFVFRRVHRASVYCVTVNTSGNLINRANWNQVHAGQQADRATLTREIARLNAANAQATQNTAQAKRRAARDAIKNYRDALSTNYKWQEGDGWFAANGVIDTVQDDGRFTYIKLKSDNRGIMSVLADIDGKTEILESTYDSTKREYRIAGVFPKFRMRAGESTVEISRH